MLDVVYVMGTSHCGSTLLAFLLNTHPEIFSIGEFGAKGRRVQRNRCSCGEFVDECPLWVEVAKEVTNELGFNFTITNRSANFEFKNRFLRQTLNTVKTNVLIDSFRKRLLDVNPYYQTKRKKALRVNEAAIRTILKLTTRKVFADTSKSPSRFLELSKISQLNLKAIWLVRDIRGFVYSAKYTAKNRNTDIRESAVRWKDDQTVIKRIYDSLSEDIRMLVRYEDLCEDPKSVMKSIFRFIGVEEFSIPDNYRSVSHHIFGNRMKSSEVASIRLDQKWKSGLSEEEQRLALQTGGEVASFLNYQ